MSDNKTKSGLPQALGTQHIKFETYLKKKKKKNAKQKILQKGIQYSNFEFGLKKKK
jgi:hypothetical protein